LFDRKHNPIYNELILVRSIRIKQIFWNAIGGVFLLSLASCATKLSAPLFSPVYVTDQAKYVLLPPSNIAVPLDMPQQIWGMYGKQEFVLDAWVQADEQAVNMVLFNSFGAGMGEISFYEKGIAFSSLVFPASLKPEYIIADFQFCFYQTDAVSTALKACGLSLFTEQQSAGEGEYKEIRRIVEGTHTVIEIEKTKTRVRYTNYVRGYTYTLGGDFS
jgi:hypothetical protein